MASETIRHKPESFLLTQPLHVRATEPSERNQFIISARKVDGRWVVLSRFADPQWQLLSKTTNRNYGIGFNVVPAEFRDSIRQVMYRFHVCGRAGGKRPEASTVHGVFSDLQPFLKYLRRCRIKRLSDIKRLTCSNYVKELKAHHTRKGQPLKATYIERRLRAVESLFELSQHTSDPMPVHPWPETSAGHMAGRTSSSEPATRHRKTPLIPDDVFTTLFQTAWEIVERGPALLDLRDEMARIKEARSDMHIRTVMRSQTLRLRELGWEKGLEGLGNDLLEIRTACYVVLASVSGCRNHELALLQTGAFFSTQDDGSPGSDSGEEPEAFWWMRSVSAKTDEGLTSWMIPEAGVQALRLMERWALPLQAAVDDEIAMRRAADPADPQIAEALRHRQALFLGKQPNTGLVRTLSHRGWREDLRAFARERCGLDWTLASHQFRRTFANYAAKSQFGDLRYLKTHFKHWSMDMTLGYALDESQDLALYIEIQDRLDDIKAGLVDSWLRNDAPLAGGYGAKIVAWRGSETVTIFKTHRHMVRALAGSTPIRSNGHAWCTADDNLCVGNDLERTRCSGCNNAVIGLNHAPLYQGLYQHLQEVASCDDIGAGGLQLVERDMARCRAVLADLGLSPVEATA